MRADQICIDTMCYTAFPLERALAGIAQIGVSRVELCASLGEGSCEHAAPEKLGRGGSNKLQRLLDNYGLTAVSFSAHADMTVESGLIDFTSRLQLAADLSIPIVNTPLPLPPERSGPEVAERFCSNLLKLAEVAAKLEVVICLDTGLAVLLGNITPQTDIIEAHVKLMKRLNHPNVRINYDAACLILFRDTKPGKNDITTLGPYLAHFHCSDKGSLEAGKWDFRTIGEGVIDWDGIIPELDNVGYTGPVSIELGWEVQPKTPEDVDDAVRRSYEFLQKYVG